MKRVPPYWVLFLLLIITCTTLGAGISMAPPASESTEHYIFIQEKTLTALNEQVNVLANAGWVLTNITVVVSGSERYIAAMYNPYKVKTRVITPISIN